MNAVYKRSRALAKTLGAPDDKEIFQLGGVTVSNSQLQGFRVSAGHKNFRAVTEGDLLAYLQGLIAWEEREQSREN